MWPKSQIPHKPGVYLFKDQHQKIIYVGKAIDLYHRVASYFSPADKNIKTSALVDRIASVETIIVQSELEALILEANLIKKYLPPFNVRLTDDKDYLYINVTRQQFPRIITARKRDLTHTLKYFGPFPSSRTVRGTLKQLRRVFPWCSKPASKGLTLRACFYYHLGLCPGPCMGEISPQNYKKIINRFIKFMAGKHQELIAELNKEMQMRSDSQKFEAAAKIKRMIEGINYLTQTNKVERYLENPNFLEDERQRALEQLQKDLKLPRLPERIEGYDISNLQGKESVGSMVVLTNGEIDKSQYRKFKIHITGRPNDVGMHKEMMRRRLKHSEWPFPDLIIIDGGFGQVRGVNYELQVANCKLPIFGLAKRMEWLYTPDGKEIRLPKSHPGLQLLIKLRDESHRFAIAYHRKLHGTIIFK